MKLDINDLKKNFRVYLLRNKKTGLYSTGGHWDKWNAWSKKGKAWTSLGHLKNHMNLQFEKFYVSTRMSIVDIRSVEKELDTALEFLKDLEVVSALISDSNNEEKGTTIESAFDLFAKVIKKKRLGVFDTSTEREKL